MKYNPAIVSKWFAEHGLYPVAEHRFHPKRQWRFDWAFSPDDKKVALEVEGGVWTSGRHTRGSGFVKDMSKYNEAACLNWRVLRVQPQDLCTMDTVEMVKRCLAQLEISGDMNI